MSLDDAALARERRIMNSTIRLSTELPPRWRVALLGASGESAFAIRAATTAAGGQVVLEGPPRIEHMTRADVPRADVLILSPPRDTARGATLHAFTSTSCPVVLLS